MDGREKDEMEWTLLGEEWTAAWYGGRIMRLIVTCGESWKHDWPTALKTHPPIHAELRKLTRNVWIESSLYRVKLGSWSWPGGMLMSSVGDVRRCPNDTWIQTYSDSRLRPIKIFIHQKNIIFGLKPDSQRTSTRTWPSFKLNSTKDLTVASPSLGPALSSPFRLLYRLASLLFFNLVRPLTGPDVSDPSVSSARSRLSERPTCNLFRAAWWSEG